MTTPPPPGQCVKLADLKSGRPAPSDTALKPGAVVPIAQLKQPTPASPLAKIPPPAVRPSMPPALPPLPQKGPAAPPTEKEKKLKEAAQKVAKAKYEEAKYTEKMRTLAILKVNASEIVKKMELVLQPNKEVLEKGFLVAEGANEYENLSQMVASYSVQIGKTSALGKSLRAMAHALRTLGEQLRQLQESIAAKVIAPLTQFAEKDYVTLETEMKRLENRRKELNEMVSTNSNDAEIPDAVAACERASADMEELLSEDRSGEHARLMVLFLVSQLEFFEKARDVIKNSINDVYPKCVQ